MKYYTIVMRMTPNWTEYLIVRLSDAGHYVVAEAQSLDIATKIMNALEAAANEPPPF